MADENRRPDEEDEPEWAGLDPPKCTFVARWMEGARMGDLAKELGRSPRRLREWKAMPEVRAAIRELMREAVFGSRSVLTSNSIYVASSLVAMATGEEPADPARVAACNASLNHLVNLAQIDDLEERIAAIEAKLNPTGEEGATT